jgi:integrase
MSPTLVRELKTHLLASGTRDATALVFAGKDGKPIDPDNFYSREYIPALERAKVKRVSFHSLRHTNVSLRIEQGQNFLYISR